MKTQEKEYDLTKDLGLGLWTKSIEKGHCRYTSGRYTFDWDGCGMEDGYVMFTVYNELLKGAGIKAVNDAGKITEEGWPKTHLSGETIATFKVKIWGYSYSIFDELAKNKPYEGYNEKCPIHGSNKTEGKCSCYNPHRLGNFMPLPLLKQRKGRSKHRQPININLNSLHTPCHNESPFRMLRELEKVYCNNGECSGDYSLWQHGICKTWVYWKQFNSFDGFITSMKLNPFIESDYFKELKENKDVTGSRYDYPKGFFKHDEYYKETMRCIKKRTKLMLDINEIKTALNEYLK